MGLVIVIFLLGLVYLSFFLSIFLGIFVLFRMEGSQKNYFLLMQTAIIAYILGNMLLISSFNANEAFVALKVMHAGGFFAAVFVFFAAANYCQIKLHPVFIKAPMVMVAITSEVLVWTSKRHTLMFKSLDLDPSRGLIIDPGPAYLWFAVYPLICLILTILLLLLQMRKWKNMYRRQLKIFLICLFIPFVSEAFYYTLLSLTGISIYLTPVSLAIMSFVVYFAVMRFNIFEFISTATLTAMEHIAEGFVLLDETNNYLSSNPSAEIIFPEIQNVIKGGSISATKNWPPELEDAKNGNVRFSMTRDETRHYEASISSVIGKNKVHRAKIILVKDITESVNFVKQLENAAYTDALTGIYNRKHFTELALPEIERAIRMNQSICFAMLDIDFFKKVNDTYGHAAGDQVLISTASIIQQTVRSYDLLGRYGGEEFVLLLSNIDIPETLGLMERIRENLSLVEINYEGSVIRINCSIGMAKFSIGDTLESVIDKADKALYTAKNNGRNQVQIFTTA